MAVTSRRIFLSTAEIIKRRVDEYDSETNEPEVMDTLRQMAIDFAMFFAKDNTNFDVPLFAEHCGFQEADVAAIKWAVNAAANTRG